MEREEAGSELPDLSEEVYLPTPQAAPPSDRDKAFSRWVVAEAPEHCTVFTPEVERAYEVNPTPATLFWFANFMRRELSEAIAHAAYTRFLRGPSPKEEWTAEAKTALEWLEKNTSRVGILCDVRAQLEQVTTFDDHSRVWPFPVEARGKALSCPIRGALRVSRHRSSFDLVATVPGCPPIKTTVGPNQEPAVFHLR